MPRLVIYRSDRFTLTGYDIPGCVEDGARMFSGIYIYIYIFNLFVDAGPVTCAHAFAAFGSTVRLKFVFKHRLLFCLPNCLDRHGLMGTVTMSNSETQLLATTMITTTMTPPAFLHPTTIYPALTWSLTLAAIWNPCNTVAAIREIYR